MSPVRAAARNTASDRMALTVLSASSAYDLLKGKRGWDDGRLAAGHGDRRADARLGAEASLHRIGFPEVGPRAAPEPTARVGSRAAIKGGDWRSSKAP